MTPSRLPFRGYSFRDDHVNEYIRTWINGDPSRVLTIINPSITQLDNPFLDELRNIQPKTRLVQIAKNASDGIFDVTSVPRITQS